MFVNAVWWSWHKVALAVCRYCERSDCCGYWRWFGSCRLFAINSSSCCAPWTTSPHSLLSSSFSSSSSGSFVPLVWRLLAVDYLKPHSGRSKQNKAKNIGKSTRFLHCRCDIAIPFAFVGPWNGSPVATNVVVVVVVGVVVVIGFSKY